MPTSLSPLVNRRYALEEGMAPSGEARVYRARDTVGDRLVALKVVAPREAGARARLVAEFERLAELDHPGLPEVLEIGEVEGEGPLERGCLFLALELLRGQSAIEACSGLSGERRARRVAAILADAADALGALHAEGLTHHDVKPAHLIAAPDGRFRLIDLGLVRGSDEADGSVHGTLAYLAPDALAGSTDPAVDLFALGVTAYELLADRLPFAATDPARLIEAQQRPPPAPPGPRALVDLVEALLARDPMARPSHARAIAEELARAGLLDETRAERARAREPGARARPGFVATPTGRGKVLARLESTTQTVAALVGPTGSGRSRLVIELDRRRAIAALRAGMPRPPRVGTTLADAAVQLGLGETLAAHSGLPPEAAERARRSLLARVLDVVERRAGLLHLIDPDAGLVDALVELAAEGQGLRVVLELDEHHAARLPEQSVGEASAIARIDVPELDQAELSALCARLVGERSGAVVRALGRLSHGRPGNLLAVVRALAARGEPITVESLRRVRVDALEDALGFTVGALPEPARLVLAALALLERPATAEELQRGVGLPVERQLGRLLGDRLIDIVRGRFVLEGAAVGRVALTAVPAARVAELATRLMAEAEAARAWVTAATIARAQDRSDAPARAARAIAAVLAGQAVDAPPMPHADPSLRALAASLPGPIGARLDGELRLRGADYLGAIERLRVAADAQDASAEARAESRLLLAQALRLGGRPEEAAAIATTLADDNIVGAAARGLRARLLLDRGLHREALSALGAEADGVAKAVQAERAEIAGLAALYGGDSTGARAAFRRLGELEKAAPNSRRARAEALLGMAAQADDSLEEAAAAYERALAMSEQAGDLHGAAVYAQNLGGTLRELGELARAEAPLRRAVDSLVRIGRREERALAMFNLANLQLSLGDHDATTSGAEAALALVQGAPASQAAFYARLLLGDVARRRGRAEAALVAYAATSAPPRATERLLLAAATAEALAEAGRAAEAAAAAANLATLRVEPGASVDARAHAAVAEARVRLAIAPEPLPSELAAELRAAADAAARSTRRTRGLPLQILLTLDAARRGDPAGARQHLAAAARLQEEITMRTPELRRAALADDPDVKKLRALLGATATEGETGPARRLLEINKRLNSELDLERLLGLILDTVLELTRAERGFLLIRGDAGELEVRCERNVEAAARAGAAAFSRSIAERAASAGEPIVTVDAAGDARFEAALSVTDLRLRSVLAVPLAVKGRVVGCVYVDHRARVGLFRPADIALVSDLAEQAAIAVENARLLAENRARQAEIVTLNQALRAQLASKEVELEGMHREVRESRRRLGVRYDYEGLIGQTPRMLELFRLLDRVTDTALPVVIYGESGTGKELVARALHHNGPRRKAAFVSESCGAIPETLLEAALFGHVRGAFTGAQGERRGLFEIADGGTLFLDEVGEMSPGMQVRLLRVLQEGEFRRVGGEKQLKVDVRIVVASNRDLGRMVEEGRFREDLFYRLNVVRVALPPLRERLDDIPLLVEHFLRAQKGKGLTRRALERLVAYRWPGNVRQLENEIARAASLADGPIDLQDLSPAVQAGTEEAEVAGPEPLDLHRRVERLERGLLEEALSRTRGNQSEAARLLGLSRFGLQKKLRRYRMTIPGRAQPRARAR